jgi:hypothetical protein
MENRSGEQNAVEFGTIFWGHYGIFMIKMLLDDGRGRQEPYGEGEGFSTVIMNI